MTPDQILATVAALLATAPARTAFPVTIEACPRPLPPAEVEGQTVTCGRVSVPENKARPGASGRSRAGSGPRTEACQVRVSDSATGWLS